MPSAPAPALLLLLHDADGAARCLKALAAAGLPEELVVVAGGASAARASLDELGGFLGARWLEGDGAALVNAAAAALAGDLILLDGATEVGLGFSPSCWRSRPPSPTRRRSPRSATTRAS